MSNSINKPQSAIPSGTSKTTTEHRTSLQIAYRDNSVAKEDLITSVLSALSLSKSTERVLSIKYAPSEKRPSSALATTPATAETQDGSLTININYANDGDNHFNLLTRIKEHIPQLAIDLSAYDALGENGVLAVTGGSLGTTAFFHAVENTDMSVFTYSCETMPYIDTYSNVNTLNQDLITLHLHCRDIDPEILPQLSEIAPCIDQLTLCSDLPHKSLRQENCDRSVIMPKNDFTRLTLASKDMEGIMKERCLASDKLVCYYKIKTAAQGIRYYRTYQGKTVRTSAEMFARTSRFDVARYYIKCNSVKVIETENRISTDGSFEPDRAPYDDTPLEQ